jgi:fructokinase
MSSSSPIYGCIEAGGTKFIVGVAASPDDVRDIAGFETATPGKTIGEVVDWLKAAALRHGSFAAIGIASFGSLELDRAAQRGDVRRRTNFVCRAACMAREAAK